MHFCKFLIATNNNVEFKISAISNQNTFILDLLIYWCGNSCTKRHFTHFPCNLFRICSVFSTSFFICTNNVFNLLCSSFHRA